MGILYMELGEFARVRVRISMKIPKSRVDSFLKSHLFILILNKMACSHFIVPLMWHAACSGKKTH